MVSGNLRVTQVPSPGVLSSSTLPLIFFENRRLAHHLLRERDAMFTFLYCPGLEATNWRAEQAIRPMVVTRKVWGGNRTPSGARTQGILLSLLETCRQQNQSALPLLAHLLCSPQPQVGDVTLIV